MKRDRFLSEAEAALDLPPGSLRSGLMLDDVADWDSLMILTFMSFVDEQFNLIIRPDVIAKCRSVDDLLAACESVLDHS